jgi:hypothetical protein
MNAKNNRNATTEKQYRDQNRCQQKQELSNIRIANISMNAKNRKDVSHIRERKDVNHSMKQKTPPNSITGIPKTEAMITTVETPEREGMSTTTGFHQEQNCQQQHYTK